MVLEDRPNGENPHVMVFAPAERIDCAMCGKEYVSRGKYDPGICYECERRMKEQNAPLVGGPLGR